MIPATPKIGCPENGRTMVVWARGTVEDRLARARTLFLGVVLFRSELCTVSLLSLSACAPLLLATRRSRMALAMSMYSEGK